MAEGQPRVVKGTRATVNRFNDRPGGNALDTLRTTLAGVASTQGQRAAAPTKKPSAAPATATGEAPDRSREGLSNAIAEIGALATAAGLTIDPAVSVATLAPHPWNDPTRSEPQPGNPKWEELLESVRENGVQMPCLAVTRAAFVKARPTLEKRIPESVTHVLIYGHRRRCAAREAGQPTMPAVVDDKVVEEGRDLDLMALENWGRDDPDPVSLAHQFALFSEELKLGQRGIATRMGMSQAKVSRIMAANLLILEAQNAYSKGEIGVDEVAKLASDLPFGPQRRWQSAFDPAQDSEARADDQRAALRLIRSGMTAARAVARVVAERQAREQAAKIGVEMIDNPAERFGSDHDAHRIAAPEEDELDPARVVASVDQDTGTLAFYSTDPPTSPSLEAETAPARKSGPKTKLDDGKARAAAQKARRAAAMQLVAKGAGREKLSSWLFTQLRYRIGAADNAKAWQLAFSWMREAELCEQETVGEWQTAVEVETDAKVFQRAIWAVALAASELRASDKSRQWDEGDSEYLELLAEVEGFTRSPWESEQLRSARKAA